MAFKGFSLDFSDVEPAGDLSVVLQAGYYKGKITGIKDHKDGAWLEILVPAQRGRTGGPVSTFMQTPTDPSSFQARKWMALFLACGFAKEKVQTKVKVTEKTLLGKEATFRYEPPAPSDDPDEKTYAEITFVTPADFAEAVKDEGAAPPVAVAPVAPVAAAAKPAPVAKTAPAPASKPAPAATPAPAPTVDDLDKELGLE